jgi:hypothetical protein
MSQSPIQHPDSGTSVAVLEIRRRLEQLQAEAVRLKLNVAAEMIDLAIEGMDMDMERLAGIAPLRDPRQKIVRFKSPG